MLETSSPEPGALAPGSVETARKPYPPPALTSAGGSTGEAVACVEGAGSSGTATGITSASSACDGATGICGAAVACISFGAVGAVEALATASSALGAEAGSAATAASAEGGADGITDASTCCSPSAGAIASGGGAAVRNQFLSPQSSHALQPLSRICLRERTVSVAV